MTSVGQTASLGGPGILDRERIIAAAGFNRWLVPPAALCIHLCIGMAYGFSVFWLPLSRTVPNAPLCADLLQELVATNCNWRVASLGWMYTLFFVVLGVAAAIWGGWLERSGPRKAGVVAALCWCGGLVLGAIGVYTHQLWLMWLGSGVIGGIGLGLGYISPVSTLVKWFPDRRGMATGMAIMGFGGGAMIGAPLADMLMNYYKTANTQGVWETLLTMGAIYLVFMMIGAFRYRIPPAGWRPDGWTPPAENQSMITQHQVHLRDAHKTKQFWMIWIVLCMNVSAGIGVIGMASPMLQEIFAGDLIGQAGVKFNALSVEQKTAIAAIAAGIGSKLLFVGAFCIILSMYGGGFATVPAYLADMFGTQFVGAIHGRLLTAWSTAGIIGPVVVNYIREFQLAAGVPRDQLYNTTMYILCAMLVVGIICNYMVKPVDPKWHMSAEEVAKLQAASAKSTSAVSYGSFGIGKGGFDAQAAIFWAFVGIPLAWGVWITLKNAIRIF